MQNYETTFVVGSAVNTADYDSIKDFFLKLITDNGGEIVNKDDWGLKNLAYPIQKYDKGYYFCVQFKIADGEFIQKLEVQYKREERIIRFLTVSLDPHAVDYLDKKRQKSKEIVSETEVVE